MDIHILLAIIKSVSCPKCFEVGSLTLVQNAKSMALHLSFVFFVTIVKIGRTNSQHLQKSVRRSI